MKERFIRSVGPIAFWLAMLIATPCSAPAEITMGVLPRLDPMELYDMFTPLAEHLSRETGEKVRLVIPKSFDDFKAMMRSNLVDLGFSNPLVYVQIRKERDIEPLAVASEPKGGTRFRGIIIARKDSGIRTIKDLREKKLIFVERDSAGGNIFQMLTLTRAGLDIRRDFTILPYAKRHDTVIMAVYNRAADAGGIREDDLGKLRGKVDLSQLTIIAKTDYYSNWPLFAMPRLSKEKAAKIRKALLALTPDSSKARAIVGPASLTGFAPISDRDYDLLREAARLVGAF
ncbi:MAG TPA: phosphate/phosphite/phosphonate ABC transporter substrate-binding protein [Nitrospirota bacterium]|nr:phosphate/phosphite/phosphonate ABC transporter substrate-binding protein [Nitrospirota bacterium]